MNAQNPEAFTTAEPVAKIDMDGPHPVDLHVGGRIRMRRKFLNLSQQNLADGIGLTFQQVQKYERGSNRVSASMLFDIARTLKAPISYFFEGYGQAEDATEISEAETDIHSFLMTTEGIELASTFPRIPSAKLRRQVLALVNSMTGEA
jgi:transcriptional regulator with XRE-family HTH domain